MRTMPAIVPVFESGTTTRQKAPNEKGFVGYETDWKPFHKEVEYKTPKKP